MNLAEALPIGIVGLLAMAGGVLMGAIAYVVLRSPVAGVRNRRLAWLLLAEGLPMLVLGSVGALALVALDQEAEWMQGVADGLMGVFMICLLATPVLYFRFLQTLDTPLTRPLRRKGAGWIAAGSAFGLVFVASFVSFLLGDEQGTLTTHAFALCTLAVPIYGLFVALALRREAPAGSEARRRASWFALAFCTRDVTHLLLFGLSFSGAFARLPDAWSNLLFALFPAGVVAFGVFMAYGILRTQLFDIDLKVKWAVRTSTLALILTTSVFLGAEVLKQFLSNHLQEYAAVVAAGLLAFALKPFERWSERLAERAVPGADAADAAYVQSRKHVVYQSAVDAATEDGVIVADERRMLERLRARLGLPPDEARAIEEESLAARLAALGAGPAAGADPDTTPQPL